MKCVPGVEFAEGCASGVTVNPVGYLVDERPVVVQAAVDPVQVAQPLRSFSCAWEGEKVNTTLDQLEKHQL